MRLSLLVVIFSSLMYAVAGAVDSPVKSVSPAGIQTAPTQASAASTSVLPTTFGGWQAKGAISTSANPSVGDPANAAVLKEYGFQKVEKASYTRDDGRTLDVKAAVFDDASGAYGAFTFYRTPEMNEEKIGGQGASLGNRVLFYQGNVLIDAAFDKLSAMSAAELRELAGTMPKPVGSAGKLPTLRNYLPVRGYEKGTEKYVTGPTALDGMNAPLASAMVDFTRGTEVVLAKYAVGAGDATLMLVEYPTPQIAAAKLREIDSAHQVTAQQPGVASIVDVGPFFDKRTGPIIAVVSGPLSQAEAREMLGVISYDADITWNENTYASKRDNLANLLFNVILLCGIVVGLSLVIGVGFGGVRILMKRLFPGRVFDRPEEMEIISLHLEEEVEVVIEERPAGR